MSLYTLAHSTSSPERTTYTDASLPLFSGRSTSSITPSSTSGSRPLGVFITGCRKKRTAIIADLAFWRRYWQFATSIATFFVAFRGRADQGQIGQRCFFCCLEAGLSLVLRTSELLLAV